MLNSSTLKILSTFDTGEFKRFEDFIKSPFFNKKNNVKKLLSEIKKYYPGFENSNLKSEQLWQKIFPGKKYNYGIMKNLVYSLHKLSEYFLQQVRFEKNEIYKSNLLLGEFADRGMDKQFEKEAKATRTRISKSPLDASNYTDKFNFETIYNGFYLNTKIGPERYRSFRGMTTFLHEFFFINFFDKYFNIAFANNYMKIDYDKESVDYIIEYFNKCPEKKNEEILIFYYLFRTAMDINDTDAFYKAKSLLEKNYERYNRRQLYFFYARLTDYCDNRVLKDKIFIPIVFDIYKDMLKKNLLNDGSNEFMHPLLYEAIEAAALDCNELEWAEKFIKEFKSKLHPSYRENFFEKATIHFLFRSKQFNKSLEHIAKLEITTPFDKAAIKMYQFKIYYELNYTEELFLLIDSTRHHIAKDKDKSENYKKQFVIYTSLMRKLISIKNMNNKDMELSLKNFKEEISGIDIFDKVWFIEKVNELEKDIYKDKS